VGDRWLSCGPDLASIGVVDAAGQPAGVIVGFPVDVSRRCLPAEPWSAPAVPGTDPDSFADALLRVLGGRFLWISAVQGQLRIYPDASAQVSCVIDHETGDVGSSAAALLDEAAYDARFQTALFNRLGVDGEGWFPAGLTAHRGIERLLPGHRLDVATGHMHHEWPPAQVAVRNDPETAADEIIGMVRAQIEALLTGPRRVALALTAGHETRMLLACARPYIGSIDIVTVVGGDRHETDSVIASRIAREMGLNHIRLPRQTATAEQRARFIRRGGHCNADSNSRFHPSVWPIAESHVFVGGLGGEIGRAFLWRASDTPATAIPTGMLIGRYGLPDVPELRNALDRWRARLPPTDAFGFLDLAYHENRNGPWYAAQFCCDPTLVRHAPLITRPGVELLMSLPPEWKRTSRLSEAVIARAWPELARFPFNSQGWSRDLFLKLQRAVANPRVLVKKFRKLRS
jgi:hypothetical protein